MKSVGSIIFWCLALLSILFAFYLQNNTMIHGDVAYLMNITNIMWSGGKYGVDIFETNPPMILYLYTPPLLLARWTGLSLELSLHLYLFALALLSLAACSYLLSKMIRNQVTLYATISAIIFSFFYLPGYQFGQREHLFIILFMPYVIAAAFNYCHRGLYHCHRMPSYCHPEPSYYHPEPSYCHPEPSYCHPEPSYCHPERSEGSPTIAVRGRSLAALGMTIGRLGMTIGKVSMTMIGAMMTIIGISAGLGLGMKPFFLWPLVLIECYLIFKTKKLFGWVRAETLAILAVLVIYIATTYYFHPTYFSLLLPLVNKFYFIGVEQPWGYMLTLPNVLYCVAAIVISYFVKKHSNYPVLVNVLWLAAIGAFLAVFLAKTAWFYHMIPAIAFAVILLAFSIADIVSPDSIRSLGVFLVAGFVIFLYPLFVAYLVNSKIAQAEGLAGKEKLIAYFSSQPGKHSITCFSSNTTGDCFPLVQRSNSVYSSRYPFFWWMRGVLKVSKQPLSAEYKNAISLLVDVVADDLNNNQTRWVVINNNDMKIVHGEEFDYIKYFSAYPAFKKAWSAYHLTKSIEYFDIYERD